MMTSASPEAAARFGHTSSQPPESPTKRSTYILNPRPTHIHNPTKDHKQTIILLHGLGNNHGGMLPLLETTFKLPGSDPDEPATSLPELLPHAKFVLPNAPLARSTVFARKKVTQWFDLNVLKEPYCQENKGYKQTDNLNVSVQRIADLVDAESELVGGYENVLILGISQGMALGATALLAIGRRIGGFVGLSGWVPWGDEMLMNEVVSEADESSILSGDGLPNDQSPSITFGYDDEEDIGRGSEPAEPPARTAVEKIAFFVRGLLGFSWRAIHDDAEKTPIFIGHGSDDEKISVKYGRDAVALFEAAGFRVTWKLFDGLKHELPQDLSEVADFMKSALVSGP